MTCRVGTSRNDSNLARWGPAKIVELRGAPGALLEEPPLFYLNVIHIWHSDQCAEVFYFCTSYPGPPAGICMTC